MQSRLDFFIVDGVIIQLVYANSSILLCCDSMGSEHPFLDYFLWSVFSSPLSLWISSHRSVITPRPGFDVHHFTIRLDCLYQPNMNDYTGPTRFLVFISTKITTTFSL